MSLKKRMCQLARQASGSHKTVHDRIRMVKVFCEFLQQQNIQIKDVGHIKAKYIERYVVYRLDKQIEKRTIQNEMAAIRKVLTLAGRNKLVNLPQLSNEGLKINRTDRSGKKSAPNAGYYQQVLEKAYQKDMGLAATLQLSRLLGLRSQEAVQCNQSLLTWKKALMRGDTSLPVIFGTKGGRPRNTRILNREKLIEAVDFALSVAKQQNGKLINRPDLKTAMAYWRNQTRRLGLTGQYSPHSLRYAWAQEAIGYYSAQGHGEKEVLALISMDLGHGDGRGRYVFRVYRLTSNK